MGIDLRDDGVGHIPIVSPAIIATILNNSNWNADGDYTGSIAGLVDGSTYWDGNWNQHYYFDGTTLTRTTYNTKPGD